MLEKEALRLKSNQATIKYISSSTLLVQIDPISGPDRDNPLDEKPHIISNHWLADWPVGSLGFDLGGRNSQNIDGPNLHTNVNLID